jgi:hypothetical protein
VTPEQHDHAFADLVQALTIHAGFTIDTNELDATIAHDPDLIADWVRAAADYLTCTHLRNLLDSPIEFLRAEITASDLNDIDIYVHMLAELVERRQSLAEQADRTSAKLTAACQALRGSGLMWPTPGSGPDQPPDTSQLSADPPRHTLARALTGLGLQPTPPAQPGTATYRWQHEQRQLAVSLTPADDPGVTIDATHGDAASWNAGFSPGTPVPVVVACVRAALRAVCQPPADDPPTAR